MNARGICLAMATTMVSLLAGCGPTWVASELRVTGGMQVPECALVGPGGEVYVSNIESGKDQYWSDDGRGFIARLRSDGTVDVLRWKDSAPDQVLSGPKGMTLLVLPSQSAWLYIADNSRLLRCRVGPDGAPGPLEVVDVPGARRLNDLANDGHSVYVSDTEAGRVYRVSPDAGAAVLPVKAPASINGLTFFEGRMFGVSWDLHEIYELDPGGAGAPKPFGLASHFKALDGIEVLDDGTFVVSDFNGGRIYTVAPDRKTVRVLAEVDSPADIGLDRTRLRLYVPQFLKDRVVVFQLTRQ